MRVRVGDVPPAVRPEAQHAPVGGVARQLSPARPHDLERRHRPLDRPRADALAERLGQLVDGQLGIGEGVPDPRDDLLGLVGREPDALRVPGAAGGRADSAPVHIGRSAVARRWTVPRGPNVFTSVRSTHSARWTSARVRPALRAMETSPAWRIWACAPTSARAMSAGSAFAAGATSELRSMRRAVTPRQVSDAMGRRTATLSPRPQPRG